MLAPGATLGGFRLDRVLGWGGMSMVYEARQLALDRVVALKVIDPSREQDPGLRARFERESRLAASLDHPNVVPIYEAGETDGVLYLAMRYVVGSDLREILAREGSLPAERVVRIVDQLAGALDAAHARGLVHRDVKPANVLIADGPDEHVYLTDFGVAKRSATTASSSLTKGGWVGSVDYVAPEQIEGGEPTPAADVYALGATVFHLLAGRPPHAADSDAAVLNAHLTQPPPSLRSLLPSASPELDRVLQRAMARRPEDRHRSAGALAADLAGCLAPAAPPVAAGGGTVTHAPGEAEVRCPACGSFGAAGARFCARCGTPLPEEGRAETRKLLTVLRVELSGTTASGESADPERVRRLLGRGRECVGGALERHGSGRPAFAGEAVTAVFGVPAAREDDALRAVRAAVDARDAVERLNRDLQREGSTRVALRMGVSTGEAVVAEADDRVQGEVVGTAVRLAAQAAPGEILIAGGTEVLLREAVAAEPVRLRGTADGTAAPTYALLDLLPGAEALPRRREGAFVGRERELAQLRQAFDRAVDEERAALLTVLGPAGIGKSRLVADFSASLGDETRVLVGRCLSYGEGIAFWPLLEIVRSLAGAEPVAELTAVMGGGAEGERAARQIALALGLAEGEAAGEETAWAMVRLFEALAERRPTVVVFEDIHWAEEPLLDLIEHLAGWIRDLPLVIVCLARGELLESRRAWGGGMPNAATVWLQALSSHQSEELVAALGGENGLEPAMRAEVVRTAEGNPLFLEQLLAWLRERGRTTAGPLTVPPTIQALLAARLDRLAAEERGLLARVAVVGRDFTREEALALTPEAEHPGIDERLRALERLELIRSRRGAEGGRVHTFRHALIADAAYAAIPKRVRSELHADYARWLERSTPAQAVEHEELLGYHYERAYRYRVEVGEDDEAARRLAVAAAERLTAAGRRAAAREDVPTAVSLLLRAAELHGPGATARLDLLPELASAMVDIGRFEEAEGVLREMAASVGGTAVEPAGGERGEALARAREAERAFRARGDERGLAHVLQIVGDLHMARCEATPAHAALREALELARRSGAVRAEILISDSLGACLYNGPAPLGDVVAEVEELIERARALGLVTLETRLLDGLALVEARRGRAAEARRYAAQADANFRRVDNGRTYARIALVEGDLHAAESHAREAMEALEQAGDVRYAAFLAAELAAILLQSGRDAEAEELLERARGTGELETTLLQATWRMPLAVLRARQGRHEEAQRLAREAVAILEPTEWRMQLADAVLALAEVLASAGEAEGAAQHAQRALDLAEAKDYGATAARVRELLAGLPAR